jgi:hypothetical protein
VTFENAAARLGVATTDDGYQVSWAALDNATGAETAAGVPATVAEPVLAVPGHAFGPRDASGARFAVASIQTLHGDYPHWAQPVRMTLRDRHGRVDVVGIERPILRNAPSRASDRTDR